MKKCYILLVGLFILTSFVSANPHGSDKVQSADNLIGRWYMAIGSIIRSDGTTSFIGDGKIKEYYVFEKGNTGYILVNDLQTDFKWTFDGTTLSISYDDGYKEKYTSVLFFDEYSLAVSGSFDYFQDGRVIFVYLALYKEGSIFYQK